MANSILIWLLTPFRFGAVSFRRGFILRSACVAVIKPFAKRRGMLVDLKEVRPADRPDLSFLPSDSMVMTAVFWFGVQGYEGVLASIWQSLCAKACSTLEVGGNVGLYAVVGGKVSTGIYTVVEPVPEIASVLRANLVRNGARQVQVLQAAVIPDFVESRVRLNVPEEGSANPVGSHLVNDSEVSGRTSQRVLDVQGIPFLALMRDCDLIKIDAEGLEYSLLASVRETIEMKRPTILIEVLPESVRLGALLAELAESCKYFIHIVPAFGTDQVVVFPSVKFASIVPGRFNSKDVILSTEVLAGAVMLP